MTEIRPQLRGLMFKLALFYVLLSLPALILVESTILILEFQRFMDGVENGSLTRATTAAAAKLGRQWPHEPPDEARASLETWTESWILRLERPREGLSPEDSYVLLELSREPLVAAVLDADGRVLARAPATAGWVVDLPSRAEVRDAAVS
ncbi:MAG: hypothetical protein WBW61_03795, partial [Rhodanobacteraceae bacterium]